MHTRIPLQPHLARAQCSVCGGALTVHEEVQGRVCAQPSCRHTALIRGIAERRERAAALLKERAREISSAIIPTLGLPETESVAVAIVPSLSRPLVRAPQKLK